MKTLGRILIILTAFIAIMGITYLIVNAVNATSSSTAAPSFARGEGFGRPEFSNGERPEFLEGRRPEFREEGARGGGWIFGAFKNIGILAVLVMLIVIPKRFMRRKTAAVNME